MGILGKIYYFFSSYTNPAERQLAKFFRRLNENQSPPLVANQLLTFLQQDTVLLTVFLEWRYKGYRYLTKATRRDLYAKAELIKQDFQKYCQSYSPDLNQVLDLASQTEVRFNTKLTAEQQDQLLYLQQIMTYLSPQQGRYAYQESSTFGNLLRDPTKEQLTADCNQIVTLYLYLYSQKYHLSSLKLFVLPRHVAIAFNGATIEATVGQFHNYSDEESSLVPAQEIVAINLLDISDRQFSTHKIPPEVSLEASRIAYLISSQREITKKNLTSAYHNLVNKLVAENDYTQALRMAKKSRNQQSVAYVGHRGAIFFQSKNQFSQALKYARYAKQARELEKTIYYNQGVYYYNQQKYHQAIDSFRRADQSQMIRKCYAGLFYQAQQELGSRITKQTIEQNKPVLARMRDYAQRSGETKLLDYVRKLEKL